MTEGTKATKATISGDRPVYVRSPEYEIITEGRQRRWVKFLREWMKKKRETWDAG